MKIDVAALIVFQEIISIVSNADKADVMDLITAVFSLTIDVSIIIIIVIVAQKYVTTTDIIVYDTSKVAQTIIEMTKKIFKL